MNSYFEVTPLVLEVGTKRKVTLKALYEHVNFKRHKIVKIQAVATGGYLPDGRLSYWTEYSDIPFTLKSDYELELEVDLPKEMEYAFKVMANSLDPLIKEPVEFCKFNLYALEADLHKYRPYCGDFHIHTFYSDGTQSPEYVAASARKVGMDFLAITDHHVYEPSLIAKKFVETLPTTLKCYPGEEVHAPDNPVHIVNFGGSYSVNDIHRDETETYRKEVEALTAEVETPMLPQEKFQAAATEWVFAHVKKAGGVAMFCHPFWRLHDRCFISDAVREEIVKKATFDCYEVIGGFNRKDMESNQLAIAHLQELRSTSAKPIPVAGVSDSHNCDTDFFSWYRTMIFAKSAEFEDLKEGIKANRSLALEEVPGEFPRLVGDFRLAQLGYYLLREYIPKHRELCRQEGLLMLDHLKGDTTAIELIAKRSKLIAENLDKVWPV